MSERTKSFSSCEEDAAGLSGPGQVPVTLQEEVSDDMEVAFFQRSQELHGQRQPCLAIVKKKNPQFGDKIRYAR